MIKNGVMMQGFEWYLPNDGNYYVDMKERAADLKESGFDSVWLPPMFKSTNTDDVGYGIYDLYDLGEFDQKGAIRTKYGTIEELRDLIETFHENEIQVFADIVLNHKAGADDVELFKAIQVDENDRSKEISEAHDIEGWTSFSFPERDGKYSDFVWNFNHFTGIDYDQMNDVTGVFKILGENKSWSDGVSDEKGNYDYLMFADIDHKHPDVVDELYHWVEWFINHVDIDGMRFDALKHIEQDFMKDFIDHIHEVSEKDLYLFGEYWQADFESKDEYLSELKYNIDLFDVVLHYNLAAASNNAESYDMRKIFDGTLVQNHPTLAVTFVDNHDSQPGQSLESFVEPWFNKIAYGLILLRKDGYPCVFYGDYYGLNGENPVEGYKETIDSLIQIRKQYAYGDQTDYFESEDLIGWVRSGNEEQPGGLAVVISSGDMNSLRMKVGEDQAGKVYVELTGDNANEIIIDDEGFGDFEVGPGTICCWAEKLAD